MIEYIITSKTRRKILALLFHHPTDQFYLRHVVRETKEEVNAVKRELDILYNGKVVLRERRMNKVFYTLNKNYLYYEEFLRIFAKQLPICEQIREALPRIGKVKFGVLSTKFLKRESIRPDEIYFLFVGTVVVPEVTAIMSESEGAFGREINFSVMTDDEFIFRKKNNDPFIWTFLKQSKVMIVGNEDDLLK